MTTADAPRLRDLRGRRASLDIRRKVTIGWQLSGFTMSIDRWAQSLTTGLQRGDGRGLSPRCWPVEDNLRLVELAHGIADCCRGMMERCGWESGPDYLCSIRLSELPTSFSQPRYLRLGYVREASMDSPSGAPRTKGIRNRTSKYGNVAV